MLSFSSAFTTTFFLLFALSGVAANDDCKDAVEVLSFPFQTTGNLTAATADFTSPSDTFGNLTCGIATSAPGVWYRIDRTRDGDQQDMFVKATVTDAPNTDTKFITALFRSQGSACNNLDCVEPRAYMLENQRTQPTMTWFAGSYEVYYLHVAGVNENEMGAFTLDVEEITLDPVANDQCSTAQSLEFGTPVTADSTGSKPHRLENADCSLHADSRGTFYKVEGTGNRMTVTFTTDMPEEHRIEVAVVTGDACDTCVIMSEFLTAEDTPHAIQFDSVPGESYKIVVSGERFSDAGEFTVEVTEEEPGAFDDAGDVFDMTPGDLNLEEGAALEGSGVGSTCTFQKVALALAMCVMAMVM